MTLAWRHCGRRAGRGSGVTGAWNWGFVLVNSLGFDVVDVLFFGWWCYLLKLTRIRAL